MEKVRYITSAGALFVPGSRLDEATIASKVTSGEWRKATDAEVADFLGTHPPKPRRRSKSDDE